MARGATEVVRHQYDRLAREYDQRWHHYITATVGQTLRRLKLEPSDRVLDLGCGTGALMRAIGDRDSLVSTWGTDLSLEMLRVARVGLGPAVPLVAADAGALPFRSGAFTVVVSTSSFHYWPSPRAVLDEIARVLTPEGRVVITDWCDDFFACRLCDRLLRLLDPAHQRSYSSRECADYLTETGFGGVTISRYKISCLWGLMTARASGPVGGSRPGPAEQGDPPS